MLCGALLLSPAVLEAKGHSGLETLCLSRCGIGQAGARALAAMLYCEPSLTSLDISGNVLEGKGVGRSFKERPLASRVLKRGLAEPPSQTIARHFHFGFITDAVGVELRNHIGVERMLWSSDYPHISADWPHSLRTIEATFAEVPASDRELILAGNARRLYGFDESLSL